MPLDKRSQVIVLLRPNFVPEGRDRQALLEWIQKNDPDDKAGSLIAPNENIQQCAAFLVDTASDIAAALLDPKKRPAFIAAAFTPDAIGV